MDPQLILLLFGAGAAAGVINAVAGGGSILTLPLLVFAGLPVGVANATNRVAIVFQNVGAMAGFRQGGYVPGREAWLLLIPSVLGAALGVRLAVGLDERTLSRAIAVILVLMLIPLFRRNPGPTGGAVRPALRWWTWPAYFAVGVYGGFVQAGVGFLYLALLVGAQGLDLVRANLIKVFLVLIYSAVALVLFALEGQVAWGHGLILAVGTTAGGWLGARLAVTRGEGWIRAVLVVAILVSAAKLMGWLDPLLGG